MTKQPSTLGQRIRQAREAKQWTQKRLAQRVGVSLTTLGKLEHDAMVPGPRIEDLEEIAARLEVKLVWLLYGKRGLVDRLRDRWPVQAEVAKQVTDSFGITVPVLKAWQNGKGALRFEGVASSTSLDRQGERLTPEAIEKMQQYSGIDLLPSHNAGVLQELGIVEKCWVDNNQFRVAGCLDPGNLEAARLHEKLKAGKQYGLSIGGRVLKAHWAFDANAGRQVKYIDDVSLERIIVCRPTQAANPDTYLRVMGEAADAVIEEQPEEGHDGHADTD